MTIERLLNTTPPMATPVKDDGLGHLERLPAELIQKIVDDVAQDPRALAGFAATSYRATAFTNQSLRTLVPPQYQTTSNRFLEWRAQYDALELATRKMLDATAGHLPCPDIFSPIDEEIVACHWALRQMQRYAQDGWVDGMLQALDNLEYHIGEASVDMPDTHDIQITGYINALPKQFSEAYNCACAGSMVNMDAIIDRMKKYAEKANVPMPDVRQIRLEGYNRAISKALAEAQQAVAEGQAQVMNEALAKAQYLADAAHLSLPQANKMQTRLLLRRALSDASRHLHFNHAMHDQERRRSERLP